MGYRKLIEYLGKEFNLKMFFYLQCFYIYSIRASGKYIFVIIKIGYAIVKENAICKTYIALQVLPSRIGNSKQSRQ